jgi:protein-tyrosine phosphatase
LVLGLTREHRAAVAMTVPPATSRTMTLREYARLLTGWTPPAPADPDLVERFRVMTSAAFGRRGHVVPALPSDDDVPDPFGGPMSSYERAASLIAAALDVPLSHLSS